MTDEESLLKKCLDKLLIANLFVVILGALFFLIGIIGNASGYQSAYKLFQSLWYPLFIPSISLFFTSVFIEALWKKISQQN